MAHNDTVTRFAPSPTGFMHIGSVRTALFAYLYARHHDGKFILRIEDTDKAREVAGATEHIMASLRWLGLLWDYGPDQPGPWGSCVQSQRLEQYRTVAADLYARGLAYADPYTSEDMERFKATAAAEKRPFLYREHRPTQPPAWDGRQPLRLHVDTDQPLVWHDAVRGELSAGEEMLDDFILMKADGYPTYNFAHIVDDHAMGVTHVMRGDEFISSTPKFLALYRALGITPPVFATLPPILRPDRQRKLGKRDGAKDILDYRADGYLPETMVNFLALIGWNPGTDEELFTLTELTERFALAQVQRSGAAFNEDKLAWMNGEYLAQQSSAERAAYVTEALAPIVGGYPQFHDARAARLAPTVLERARSAAEIRAAAAAGEYDYAFAAPEYGTDLLAFKRDPDVNACLPRLRRVHDLLADADMTSPESIKAAVWEYAEDIGRGEVLWPLRVALTGRERSPDPFTVAFVIGRDETLARIDAACAKIGG